MTLQEVIKSGKSFKRKDWEHFYTVDHNYHWDFMCLHSKTTEIKILISKYDILADDWEVKSEPKKMKLLAYVDIDDGDLTWRKEGFLLPACFKRFPSEDKEVEIDES
jgi:hypothetical protein